MDYPQAEKAWDEHMKNCFSCSKLGKYNKFGGTTEAYHGFIKGYLASHEDVMKIIGGI